MAAVKIISPCDDEVTGLAAAVLAQYHGDVAELKPKIGYFFVEFDSETLERIGKKAAKALKKGEILEPPAPLKLHGVRCAATIKANSYADRVQGKPDVTVTIDKAAWDGFSQGQRVALLDHELEHLAPKLVEGVPTVDDIGRPIFTLRGHDWELSGFASVTQRHGRAAIEVKSMVNFISGSDGQMIMEFAGMKLLPASDNPVSDEELNRKKIEEAASDPQFLKAVRDLCPAEGEGSITVTVGTSEPVTLTSETRDRINKRLKASE